jgi:chitin synthase
MYMAFEKNPKVAGVTGEIAPLSSLNCNPLVSSQVFEYNISSILDKTMESVFGYISVLPGAFSAYRYEALLGQPLKTYFHNLSIKLKDQTPFSANMYLAEDRVLCYELVAKKNCDYVLKYVHQAKARTDVPTNLTDLIKQRRRWINGSLFALMYALLGWPRLLVYSGHSIWRKLMLTLQFLYYSISMIMQWTAITHFFIMFRFLIQDNIPYELSEFFTFLFIFLLLLQIVLGLGNKPKNVSWIHLISAVIFGSFSVSIVIIIFPLIFKNKFDWIGILSLVLTILFFSLAAILYKSVIACVSSFAQYIFFTGTYVIILPIYSLCNTHDISWGTKNSRL